MIDDRYLHEQPLEIDDFLDSYHVTQRKLMIACKNTMGEETFSQEMTRRYRERIRAG
jgi:hypothetical protein